MSFGGGRQARLETLPYLAADLPAFWLWRLTRVPQSSVEGNPTDLPKGVPTASATEVRTALNETSRGVK
jgi:hypothetical protein